jgi:IMP dehydrogenase
VPEGIVGRVPFKGMAEMMVQYIGGLRAGMGCDAPAICELKRKSGKFVRISIAGMKERDVHDIVITNEAPNYSL